jgi:hypothetical protein
LLISVDFLYRHSPIPALFGAVLAVDFTGMAPPWVFPHSVLPISRFFTVIAYELYQLIATTLRARITKEVIDVHHQFRLWKLI